MGTQSRCCTATLPAGQQRCLRRRFADAARCALPRPPRAAAAALTAVVEACKPGAKIVDLCEKGDSLLNE